MNNKQLLTELENMGAEVEDVLERMMGDEEMYIDFLKQLPDNRNIVELRKAVDAGDVEKATAEVHTLKGIALNLGLLPLADVSIDMLTDFRAGNTAKAMERINDVEDCFKLWAKAIAQVE